MYTGHRTTSRLPIIAVGGSGDVLLLGAGNGVSHPLHQLQGGHLEARHGDDHWGVLAAQHGAREVRFLAKYRNHAELKGVEV